jgi:dTDP-4-dehydrorhamnose reductase
VIFQESGLDVNLFVTTEQFLRAATRPAYSVPGHDALRRAGFAPLRHWREALSDFMQRE